MSAISRQHGEIIPLCIDNAVHWSIWDKGPSANGVFVNNNRVVANETPISTAANAPSGERYMLLKDGDMITFGGQAVSIMQNFCYTFTLL